MYKSFILSIMEYAFEVLGGTYDSNIVKLEQINVKALSLITGATSRSNIANLYTETGFPSFMERRNHRMLLMMYKIKKI